MSAKNDNRRKLDMKEVCQLLGGLFAGLLIMTDLDTLRRAVGFWFENDDAWNVVVKAAGTDGRDERTPPKGSGGYRN